MNLTIADAGLLSASLLLWTAIVYFTMAAGVRSGDLVWTGHYIGRLPAHLRLRSVIYGLGLLMSGFVLLDLTGTIETSVIPEQWVRSAGFGVTAFLGIAGLMSLVKGSRWERMLFAFTTLLGAGLAAWVTFG